MFVNSVFHMFSKMVKGFLVYFVRFGIRQIPASCQDKSTLCLSLLHPTQRTLRKRFTAMRAGGTTNTAQLSVITERRHDVLSTSDASIKPRRTPLQHGKLSKKNSRQRPYRKLPISQHSKE